MESNHRNFKIWTICAAALVSFAAGSLASACLVHPSAVSADSNRVFELHVYHAVPGKVPALESRFRDASKLLAKHNLEVVGFWVPNNNTPAWDNTFVYLVAASSREEGKKNWNAFHADPEFQRFLEAEKTEKLIESVDTTYMRPTDFSGLR